MFDFQPESNGFLPQLDNQKVLQFMGERCQIGNQQAHCCIGLGHPDIPLAVAPHRLFKPFQSPIAEKIEDVPNYLLSALRKEPRFEAREDLGGGECQKA